LITKEQKLDVRTRGETELIDLHRSRTRASVVRELFSFPEAEIHVRALARLTGEAVANVHREVKRLEAEGWVVARPSGNRLLYRVDTEHRLYPAVSELVEETVGATGLLREALAGLPEVRLALLLRPPAAGRRDLLVVVVGEIETDRVSAATAPAAARLRAAVQPLVFARDELLGRLRQHDTRTMQLLEAPHTVLIGDEQEVRALVAAARVGGG
jgi:DNA-binding MarR family transcriptional regulator